MIRKISLPKGSLNYFHRVMNWNHTPCADSREDQQLLSLRGIGVIEDVVLILRMIDEFP